MLRIHSRVLGKLVLVVTAVVVSNASAQDVKPERKERRKFDPKRWEKTIADFEAKDKQSLPPKNALLFVGSSSIRLWKLKKSFPDLPTINRGFGGSHIADSVHYADRIILKHKPRVVVLYAGDNDVAHGMSPKEVAQDFRRFVAVVHKELPRTRILFIAIKPSIKRWKLFETMKRANERIAGQCRKDKRLAYVDIVTPMLGQDGKPRRDLFAKDGLHLNAAGYKVWADTLRPHLRSERGSSR